ncbi:hypothetical protein BDV96DRAFT_474953, partial [Lophiotrema nucula]
TATYNSPTNSPSPHTISASLPSTSANPATEDRVAHLAALQSSVKTLQGDVNTFLTQKMEEDKVKGAATVKVDDAKEEENYGEEVVEED